ncbi:MAG: transcription-repair coupling factor [Ignavibacteriae bacterium]|nr:MAG: transcription-repair coupling factor [Ignavibacteriota bacterium]
MIGVRCFHEEQIPHRLHLMGPGADGEPSTERRVIEQIKKRISESEPFQWLTAAVQPLQRGNHLQLQGLNGSLIAFAACRIFESRTTQLLLVAPDKDRAEQFRDDCAALLGDARVCLYVSGPAHAAMSLDMSAPIAQMETLRSLSRSEKVIVVASAEALTVKLPPKSQFVERAMDLDVGKEYPFEGLLGKLTGMGFLKKDFVEEYGDFALRGGILDVFPFVGENPIRFEFWGDTVESIREFDVLSQRSIRELQSANIVANLFGDPHPESPAPESPGDRSAMVSIFEYLSPDALVLFDDPILVEKEIEELQQEGFTDILDWESIKKTADGFARIDHAAIHKLHDPHIIDFQSHPQPPIAGSIKRLLEHMNKISNRGYAIYLACDTKEEGERLDGLIEEELTAPDEPGPQSSIRESPEGESEELFSIKGDDEDRITDHLPAPIAYQILPEALHSGFVFPSANIAVFTEHEIFGRLKRRGTTARKKFKGLSQKELQQLRRGDFVVHQDYGIGRFAGLHKIKLRGVEAEVMKLVYEENDALYVHLNFVDRVQKYSSQEGHTPKLSKLGGSDWDRLKSRARRKIKDIARDLIKLYARRKHEQGFSFAPDTHWQKEMEASFLYEDTPDQAKSTMDVKRDMEQPSPMDRLICGDVGFGKTEVAVRAAFKAVMNGKQVALLVPTTILAQQHYYTFSDRISRYSVRVESLTRFRPKNEQKKVLEDLKEGKVDVLIGTHRLLSKDVVFKDLGLLIIDEEQRFGVASKEKLRQLRASVDTLTLTATPIPRTLQFSLMGARDLSLINTPPRNRIPIQTEIAQFDLQLIHEVITKELHRGGQVYVVHDRVQNIDTLRAMLEERIPQARFHVAHGQMKGHELEKAMMDFLEKKFDVLLCTKIIESGIDIPSVNTIIINRADRFGLAELYQLRGRVGRSNIQAYAYLLTPPLSVLPRVTLRRLQAIQEFTELGSGFNLAMRDLEIRGAGNLLGGEQSGFILEMGFEMYQRVVEEAVAELKNEEFNELVEKKPEEEKRKMAVTVIETDIEALLPDLYIEHDAERLDIYRRLYRSSTGEEVSAMRRELRDRFGEYPEEVEHLFRQIELKVLASTIGFIKLELEGDALAMHFPPPEEKTFYEGDHSPFQSLMGQLQELKPFHPHLKQDAKQLKLTAKIKLSDNQIERLDSIKTFLEKLRVLMLPGQSSESSRQ